MDKKIFNRVCFFRPRNTCNSLTPFSSWPCMGRVTRRVQVLWSSNGLRCKNLMSEYKSSSSFWIGVPEMHQRRSALSCDAARDCFVRRDLIVCASSSTTRRQKMLCRGPRALFLPCVVVSFSVVFKKRGTNVRDPCILQQAIGRL